MCNQRFSAKAKYLFLIACCVLAATAMNITATVSAQGGATALDFEKPVKGEITNSQYAINYTFSDKANDIIVITMDPDFSGSGFLSPQLILLDSKNNKVADTSAEFSFSSVNLALQLAADGNYTITATRAKGKAGDSQGKFDLGLYKAAVLTAGTPVKGKLTSSAYKFYMYTSDSAFSLTYQKTAGDFSPDIEVNTIDNNTMDAQHVAGELSGTELTSGTITITPADKTMYIVKFGHRYSSDKTTANFSLAISPAE